MNALLRTFVFSSLLALIASRLFAALPSDAPVFKEARDYAAEGSWSRALASYEALLPKLEGEEARWCAFLLEDAAWRAEAQPSDWQTRQAWLNKHRAVYASLQAPYSDKKVERDELWCRIKQSEIDFSKTDYPNSEKQLDLHLELLDFRLTQVKGLESARNYFSTLVAACETPLSVEDVFSSPIRRYGKGKFEKRSQRLLDHLAAAAENRFLNREDQAWCLIAWNCVQYFSRTYGKDAAAQWRNCVEQACGTRWENLARANAFLFDIIPSGFNKGTGLTRKIDVSEKLSEISDLIKALEAQPQDALHTRTSKELSKLALAWSIPLLQVTAPSRIAPGEAFRFDFGEFGYHSLRCELYRCTPQKWLEQINNPVMGTEHIDKLMKDQSLLRSWLLALPNPKTLEWKSAVESALPSLEPGLYALVVTGWHPLATQAQVYKFICTDRDVAAIAANGMTETLVLYRSSTQELLGKTEASFTTVRSGSKHQTATHRLKTDAWGQVKIPGEWITGNFSRCLVIHENHPAVISLHTSRWSQMPVAADVFVERPLFRPGETARWKLMLRQRSDQKWIVPWDDYSLEIRLGNQSLTEIPKIKLDDHGCIDGSIEIPSTARLGQATLRLHRKGYSNGAYPVEERLFQVDSFQPPPVLAKIEFVQNPPVQGADRELIVRVKTDYYSGGPASGAKVGLKLVARGPQDREEMANRKTALKDWCGQLEKREFMAETDSEGVVEFHINLPSFVKDITSLHATAVIAPIGSGPFQTNARFLVSEARAFISGQQNSRTILSRPGAVHRFELRIEDGAGKPLSAELQAELVELRWKEIWKDPSGNSVEGRPAHVKDINNDAWLPNTTRDNWTRLKAGYEEVPVAEKAIRSDADGSVKAEFRLPRIGCYGLQICRGGKRVRDIQDNGYGHAIRHPQVLAVDDASTELALSPGCSLVATPEGLYMGGDSHPVLLVLPQGAKHGILTVSSESEVKSLFAIARGRLALLSIDVPYEQPNRYRLQFDIPSRYSSWRAPLELDKKPDERDAKLDLSPTTAQHKPGSTARLSLVSSEQSSKTLPAQIALSVSDESVHVLAGDNPDRKSDFPRSIQMLHANTTWSEAAREPFNARAQHDPRPGIGPEGMDETIQLSPFMVGSGVTARGYMASSTVAGTRVVTKQMLSGAGGSDEIRAKASLQPMESPSTKPITLRRHFASTAFWAPKLQTDKAGKAEVEFKLPDNLTTWRARAYAIADDLDRFATATTTFVTSLPFQARLQIPRFLVEGDRSHLLGTFVNRSDSPMSASALLKVEGPVALESTAAAEPLAIPQNQEIRNSWQLLAKAQGSAKLQLEARAGAEADAMELSLPILEDGSRQPIASSAILERKDETRSFSLLLPDPLDPARTEVKLHLTPSLAGAMVDALPFLIDYPYGCVEQTMSRFLPAIVVKKSLTDLGFNAAQLEKRILARSANPKKQKAGFDKLNEVVTQSLDRLAKAQCDDGSFGWWPGAQQGDLWMSAYVAWGLNLAEDTGISVEGDLRSRLLGYLLRSIDSSMDDTSAWALAALSRYADFGKGEQKTLQKHWANAFEKRQGLSPAGLACLGIASAKLGTKEQKEILSRNLENAVVRSNASGLGELAQWGSGSGYWRAMDGAVEATALSLMALLQIKPEHPLIPAAARWLALNRRSAAWNSSRDTAFAVLALNQYLVATREAAPDGEIEVLVNGVSLGRVRFDEESMLAGPSVLTLRTEQFKAGENHFELKRIAGKIPVYAIALSSAWARGDSVVAQGHLLSLLRGYDREAVQISSAAAPKITRSVLGKDDSLRNGERLWAELTLSAPQDFEYLMIEIPKPAGCEPLNPLSGWDVELKPAKNYSDADKDSERSRFGWNARMLYREEYDDRSVVFIHRLSAGEWKLRLGLQAVFAGDYRALPAKVEAMYVPEIRANSTATRIKID